MRAPISIVIPTLNAGGGFAATLGALAEGLDAGLIRELIVSDGGSDDGTKALAEAAGADWVTGQAGRGGQLRRGAEGAQGAWLLFVHADTVLDHGWAEAALKHLQEDPDSAAYFNLGFRTKGTMARFVAGWANLRSRTFGLPYGDQALLVSRQLYDQVGGFDDIPLMEDVAIARALRGKIVGLDCVAWTSAARYEDEGWFWRGAKNLWTLLRYLLGADPKRLASSYQALPRRKVD